MGTLSRTPGSRFGAGRILRVLAMLLAAAAPAQADFMAGQVVDGQGVGIAGVDIDVKNTGSGGTDPIFNDGTDANGFFFTTINPSTYLVTFKPPPPPLSTSLVLTIPEVAISGTTNIGTIQLPQGVALLGRCVNKQGFPAASVGIDAKDGLTGADIPLHFDTTNLFGTFAIAVPPGPLEMRFLTKGVLGFKLAPRAMPVNLTSDTDLGDILLEDGFVISATVTNPLGGVIPNCDADVIDAVTGEKLFTPNDNTNLLGVANVVVPAGTYDFILQPTFALHLVSQTIPSVTVAADVPLGTIALEAGFVLSGTVLADSALLPGINVDVEDPLTAASVTLSGDATSATGSYQVIVPPGTWDVQFIPPAGQPYDRVEIPGVVVAGPTTLHGNLPFCPLPCGPASILSVTPGAGHPTGATRVTILGENFRDDGSIGVFIGGVAASVAQVIVPNTLLVDTPPGTPGALVDVSLTSSNGPALLAGAFTYDDPPPPVVTGITPATGLFHTPTAVTLTGTDFDALFTTTVSVGGKPMTDVIRVDAQTLTGTVAAGLHGDLGDVVVTQNGVSSSLSGAFAWIGTEIVSVSPGMGHPAVATPVTITGSFFAPDSTASFGGVPATISAITPLSIEAIVPPGLAGSVVDLVVTGSDGTDTLAGGFSFLDPPPPVLSGLSPASGLFHTPTPVTLTGTGFDSFFSTTVTFGGVPAVDVAWLDGNTMVATAPVGTQGAVVDVVLTQDGAASTLPAAWSWAGTTLLGVEPDVGHPGLPTEVTITGALIAADSTVTFGGVPGTVLSVTPTELVTLAPPGPAGKSVDILVTGSDGTASLDRSFHYEEPADPVLASTTPSTGLFHSPTAVTLDGQEFDAFYPISVTFGGLPATDVTRVSDTVVTALAPAGNQGQVGDVVLTQNGKSSVLPDAFRWLGTRIDSVFPASGHPAVETPVTITGEFFAADSTVSFGGTPGLVLAVTPISMDVSSPPGTPGAVVDVTVTGSDGTDTAVGAFTYDDPPPPVLAGLSPAEVLFHEATAVTLTGTDFDPFFPLVVTFDGLPAGDVQWVSATEITCTAPLGSQGQVGDVVLDQDGEFSILPAAFTWVGTSIASVTPGNGHPLAQTPVTISGEFFAPNSTVSFGGAAGLVLAVTPTSMDVSSPPGPPGAVVDVTVTGSDGTDTAVGAFTYDVPPPPVLAGVSPASGLFHTPTAVTLTGTDFDSFFSTTVTFGGVPAVDVTWLDGNTMLAMAPAGSQGAVVDVVLTQNGQPTTLPAAFTWVGTSIASVTPGNGHPLAQTPVTITGEFFAADSTASFGGTPGVVLAVTPTSMDVSSPTGTPGAVVDVTVTGSDGTDTAAGAFTYDVPPPPVLAGVSPAGGLFHSPTPVTLAGTGFDALYPLAITVDGLPSTDVARVSDSVITLTIPANTQGAVGDVVLTQNGHSSTLAAAFRWEGTRILSLTPSAGLPTGGTQVTLLGEHLPDDGSLSVLLGGNPATIVSVDAPGSAVFTTPPGQPASTVDVVVSSSDGTDTAPGGFFYDDAPPPVLTSIAPSESLFHSPTDVTLSGADFSASYPLAVTVGGLPASNVVRVSDTVLTATLPANSQGASGDVVVTQNGHVTMLADAFRWVGTGVADIAPTSGHPAVETLVTIAGEHFAPDTSVTFGSQPATVLSNTGSVLQVLAPTGSSGAVVDVLVSGTDGTHTTVAGFTYDAPPPPVLAGVSPAEGLFHTPAVVTITGTDFDAFFSLNVTVGGLPASQVNRLSATEITALIPANVQGATGDIVLNQDGQTTTLPSAYTWVGTQLTALSPANGHPAVETLTTLTGLRIAADSSVTFDGVPATVLATTPTSIEVAAPAGTPGAVVDVTVTGANGTDSLTAAFTYDTPPAPTLVSIAPDRGLFHTPTDVTITGTGFDAHYQLALSVSGLTVSNVVRLSDTELTGTIPAHVQGATGDLVIEQNGQADTLSAAFTWEGTRLLAIAPNKGHPNGGVPVTITGEHFVDDGSLSVSFGATPVAITSITLPDTLTVMSPPGSAGGIVEVTIDGSNGTDTLLGGFTFVDPLAPVLTSVSPSTGLFHTLTRVTLTGSDFDPLGVHSVSFDGLPATDVTYVSPTVLTAVAPAGTQDQVADVVVVQDGKSAVLGAAFIWVGTSIASLTPDHGHPAVETPVDLTGAFFAADSTISFGSAPGTVLSVTPDSLAALAPSGTPGTVVDVIVTGSDGTDTRVGGFRWDDVPAPTVATVDPAQSLFHVAAPVTLTGTGFDEHYALTVTFGGVLATNVVRVSSTQITCAAPTGIQDTVGDVIVTQNGQSATLPDGYRWFGTHLFAVSPGSGHPSGSTLVTLTGEHFAQGGDTQVRFGGLAAANVVVLSDTTLTAETPQGTPGATVDVEVSGTNGEDVLVDGYTYDDPLAPKLLAVSPSSGLFHAATLVTLTGESFDPLATFTVSFGEQAATEVTYLSDTMLTARTPLGTQGDLVDVTVTQDGHSATLPDAFGYVGTRLIALDPPQGPPAGGPAVTLTGTFIPDDGSVDVRFGALSAQVLSVSVPDTVVVQVPVGVPGETVDVSITSTNGEDTLPGGFTYEVLGLVALSPDTGPAAGGPPIVITGEHFLDDGSMQVDFGGLPASILSIDDSTTMTVEIPQGARGSVVDVTVRGTNGTATLPGAFTYAITALASADPSVGPPDGGDMVVILGEAFVDDGSTQVFFDDSPAEVLDIVAPHTLTVRVPPGDADAVVDITVSSSNGTDVLPAAYTYGDFMLRLGDGIDGVITPGDVDTLFFEALQDSRITLQMRAGKGSGIAPRMRLIAPDETVLLTPEASAPKGKAARVKNLTLPATGRYRLELLGDADSTGAYRFRSRLRPVTKVNAQVFVNAATPQVAVSFGALPGWELRRVKVIAKKSKKAPDVLMPALELTTPDGATVDLAPFTTTDKTGTRLSLKGVPLESFGSWTLTVSGADGSTGEAKVAIKLRKPKVPSKVVQEP